MVEHDSRVSGDSGMEPDASLRARLVLWSVFRSAPCTKAPPTPRDIRQANATFLASLAATPPQWATLFGQRRGPAYEKLCRFFAAVLEWAGTRAEPLEMVTYAASGWALWSDETLVRWDTEAAVDAWLLDNGTRGGGR